MAKMGDKLYQHVRHIQTANANLTHAYYTDFLFPIPFNSIHTITIGKLPYASKWRAQLMAGRCKSAPEY